MKNTRRSFIKKSAVGSAALTIGMPMLQQNAHANVVGANDRINCAVVGVNSRGKAHVAAINADPNAKVLYSCDVDDKIIKKHNKWCKRKIGYVPKVEKDFRKLLEIPEIDAVFIATPEHWHAPMAIMAMKAGKHVYVEKPCSHNAGENELLVAAQKKYGTKVQMGNQQRSSVTTNLAIKEIREGIIGEVYKGEAYYSNNRKSIGRGKEIPVPDSLDWDLWQGPAPRQKYRDNVHPYNWHWFTNWGTGEVHNNGTHEIDICRWALGEKLPNTVTSFGGKYTYDDDWQFPDNQQVTFTFDNDRFITWTGHSRGHIQPEKPGRGVSLYGSKGAIMLDRNFYKLFDLDGKLIKNEIEEGESKTTDTQGMGNLDVNHVANFFAAIRVNEPLNAEIKDASISTMLCHLGNMAQSVGHTLIIDKASGKVINCDIAMSMWNREYEPGWEVTI